VSTVVIDPKGVSTRRILEQVVEVNRDLFSIRERIATLTTSKIIVIIDTTPRGGGVSIVTVFGSL